MSKPKRTFTAEFKRDAIALAEHGDRSVAQIERDLGLSAGCLRHWRADARRAAAAGTTTDALADQARELQRLRRANARLREERDTLKKAVAIFVHPCYGSRRLRAALAVAGPTLSRDHIRRLMRLGQIQPSRTRRRRRGRTTPTLREQVVPNILAPVLGSRDRRATCVRLLTSWPSKAGSSASSIRPLTPLMRPGAYCFIGSGRLRNSKPNSGPNGKWMGFSMQKPGAWRLVGGRCCRPARWPTSGSGDDTGRPSEP